MEINTSWKPFNPFSLNIKFETSGEFVDFYNALDYGIKNERRKRTNDSDLLALMSELDKIFNRL